MKTVTFVDLKRFMGDWYVIANIPTFIEKRATNAIESYRLNDKGEIETTFTFHLDTPKGEKKVYTPKGIVYNTQTNAEWKMQFFWLLKLPFLIIELPNDYSYTVIGHPSRKYVWIMARKSVIPANTYEKILINLSKVGYDIDQIQKVTQVWD